MDSAADHRKPTRENITWRVAYADAKMRRHLMTTDRPVRVGVLGAGAWAEFAHLPGYKRDARCELVAIADPVVEKAQSFAAKFGIPNVHASHEELIARDD